MTFEVSSKKHDWEILFHLQVICFFTLNLILLLFIDKKFAKKCPEGFTIQKETMQPLAWSTHCYTFALGMS